MAKTWKTAQATLAHSPSQLLHRALQLALDLYADEASGLVTQRQFAVLSAVAANEGLSQTDLVRATGIDRSTLAELVARMIGKDLLERERSERDARAKTVRLTAAGRDALAAAEPRAAAADGRLMRLLGERKAEKFLSALESLVAAGEQSGGGPAEASKPAKPKDKGGKKHKKKKKAEKTEAAPEPAED